MSGTDLRVRYRSTRWSRPLRSRPMPWMSWRLVSQLRPEIEIEIKRPKPAFSAGSSTPTQNQTSQVLVCGPHVSRYRSNTGTRPDKPTYYQAVQKTVPNSAKDTVTSSTSQQYHAVLTSSTTGTAYKQVESQSEAFDDLIQSEIDVVVEDQWMAQVRFVLRDFGGPAKSSARFRGLCEIKHEKRNVLYSLRRRVRCVVLCDVRYSPSAPSAYAPATSCPVPATPYARTDRAYNGGAQYAANKGDYKGQLRPIGKVLVDVDRSAPLPAYANSASSLPQLRYLPTPGVQAAGFRF
eukprot:387994-Rhodomonas_salina.1